MFFCQHDRDYVDVSYLADTDSNVKTAKAIQCAHATATTTSLKQNRRLDEIRKKNLNIIIVTSFFRII